MVALSSPASAHHRIVPPPFHDPGEPLQLAFNPQERKIFVTLRDSIIVEPGTLRRLREYLLRDNHGNHWLTYLGHAIDFEIYQSPTDRSAFLKPIAGIKEHGGITQDLMDLHRKAAFRDFAKIDHAILAARASSPVGP
jgi:hypothetical protein